ERKHAHAKGNGAPAELAPDTAHANNAEGLVVEFDALQVFPVPGAALQRRIGPRDVPGKTKQQGKSELSRRDGVGAWRVQHHHAPARCSFNIDIVHPDRKSTRLNSSHQIISYAVFCLKKKKTK